MYIYIYNTEIYFLFASHETCVQRLMILVSILLLVGGWVFVPEQWRAFTRLDGVFL